MLGGGGGEIMTRINKTKKFTPKIQKKIQKAKKKKKA